MKHKMTSMSRAPISARPEASCTRSGFLTECSRRFRSGAEIPVGDLRAGPEQHAGLLADDLEYFAEIFEAMRHAHDVGMQRERHDARGVGRIGVDLLELVER